MSKFFRLFNKKSSEAAQDEKQAPQALKSKETAPQKTTRQKTSSTPSLTAQSSLADETSPAFTSNTHIPHRIKNGYDHFLQEEDIETAAQEETSYFARLRRGLSKTRSGFADLLFGKKNIDEDLVEELELRLLTADVGIEVTTAICDSLNAALARDEVHSSEAVRTHLYSIMSEMLRPAEQALDVSGHTPFVILMVGINGAGKTTTIGKLACLLQKQGKNVMLAAADTFRAAAVEQLQVWGERNHIPVIAQGTGADAASVAYDALQSATAHKSDVLIIDTAGRLHTQSNLMEELKKIKRVLQKFDAAAPHETLLVLDAGNGQNALRQAEEFHQAITLDGLILTKLDGTAKGGIIFAVSQKLKLPIRFIGVGEGIEDLREFHAQSYVKALFYAD